MNCVPISDELTALRDRFAGCTIVAFADLSTGMVFAADTENKTTQEKLDALCAAGKAALLGQTPLAVTSAFTPNHTEAPQIAIVANENGVQCFVRALAPAHEALCFVLNESISLEYLISEACNFLAQFSSEAS